MSTSTMTLGEAVDRARGLIRTGPFGSQLHAHEYVDDPEGVPVVMPNNLVGGRVSRDGIKRVSEETAQRLRHHRLVAGDLVLARRGDIGRLAAIGPEEQGWLCGTGSIRVHVADRDVVDPGFLGCLLEAPAVKSWLVGQAIGATMPNLNAEIVSSVPVSVPGIDLQRRIGSLLSAFGALVELNERRIRILESLGDAVFREWFEKFRFPGHPGRGSDPLPAGWESRRLREVVTTQYGVTASAIEGSSGPQLLRGMDINKRSFVNWGTVPHCDVSDPSALEKYRLEIGDVCVIRMANPGKAGIVERDVDAVFGSYLVRMKSTDPRLTPYLLYHFLRSPGYQRWVDGSSTGATRKSASAAVLTEPSPALPPVEVAERFEQAAGTLRRQLNVLVEQSEALAATRDLLLPRLVAGQLDVSDVDLGVLAPAEPE